MEYVLVITTVAGYKEALINALQATVGRHLTTITVTDGADLIVEASFKDDAEVSEVLGKFRASYSDYYRWMHIHRIEKVLNMRK